MTKEENEEMAEKIFDAFCVDETRTLNHVECIEAMMEFGAWVAKNLHKPLVTSSYDAEDMKEAYEYGKGYGTGNFDEWLKNRNCS